MKDPVTGIAIQRFFYLLRGRVVLFAHLIYRA